MGIEEERWHYGRQMTLARHKLETSRFMADILNEVLSRRAFEMKNPPKKKL